MVAAWTSAQIRGMSVSEATLQTKRRWIFFKSDIAVVDVGVGGTGWVAVVMAAVTPCVAARIASLTMAPISNGGAGTGMVTGGGEGAGAGNVTSGVARSGVSRGPLVGVRIEVLVGRVLGVSSSGGGVRVVRAVVVVPAPDASGVVGEL